MRATWVVLALLVAAPGRVAFADDAKPAAPATAADVKEAQKYYEAGRQAFAAGQFVVAISAFEEAYKIAPRTSVKFSLAMAYRAQYFIDQDVAKVRRAVELFRAVVEETPQGELREKSAGHLAELSPVLMRVDAGAAARAAAEAATPPPAPPPPAGDAPAGEAPAATPPPPAALPPPVAPPKTQLMISSRTPGARVSIDGEPFAEAPVIKETTPGKHQVRVELDGYFPQVVEGTAVDGRFIVVEVNLEPKPAELSVDAPAGAEVSIDGKPIGEAPLRSPAIVPAGTHQVLVLARGHRAWSQDVKVGLGEKKRVQVSLVRTGQRRASYIVLGAAAATAIAGGVTTFMAFSAQSDAQDIEARIDSGANITPAQVVEHRDLVDKRDRYESASYFLYGTAFVVATTGLFLYLVDQPRAEAGATITTPAVVPEVQKDQFTVSWVQRF